MTATARWVLRDCEAALDMLEHEEDEQRWRVLWAGAVTLLRTVGHALHKVDGADNRVRRAADAAWSRWKRDRSKHAVFWEFIEKERNNVLKEYRLGVLDSGEVGLVVVATRDKDQGEFVSHETPGLAWGQPLPAAYQRI